MRSMSDRQRCGQPLRGELGEKGGGAHADGHGQDDGHRRGDERADDEDARRVDVLGGVVGPRPQKAQPRVAEGLARRRQEADHEAEDDDGEERRPRSSAARRRPGRRAGPTAVADASLTPATGVSLGGGTSSSSVVLIGVRRCGPVRDDQENRGLPAEFSSVSSVWCASATTLAGKRRVPERGRLLLAGGGDPVEELAEHDPEGGVGLLLVDERPAEVGERVGARPGPVDDVEVGRAQVGGLGARRGDARLRRLHEAPRRVLERGVGEARPAASRRTRRSRWHPGSAG